MTKANKAKTSLLARTPVVAVMGHVDHGKTSLLDAIRGTDVQTGEVGGITQNTRAHQIEYNGQKITFIDTPGHEAFKDMRSRGAKVTDIVVLVVAADDGVQPQTKESIKFAKASKTPIIVAINKIDLPGAKSAKVKQELSQFDVLVEDFGGDVMVVEVSAKTGKNIDSLLESIILQAEVMEIKETKTVQGIAEAVVLESTLDKQRGPITLALVKSGEFEIGDYVIYPPGKYKSIRSLNNEFGKRVETAKEGDPIWIVGCDDVIATGEQILLENDMKKAIQLAKIFDVPAKVVEEVEAEIKEEIDGLAFLTQMLDEKEVTDSVKYLKIVLKTDTQGTLEAVKQKLEELGDDFVKVKVLQEGTGAITEKDVLRAKNTKGIVIGFQTEYPTSVEMIAKREKVLVRNYEIIYKLIEEVEAVLHSMLDPVEEIVEVARASVKQVFALSDGKKVAGCKVTKGLVIKGYKCFVLRGEEEIANGRIVSLKHLRNEVKEVKKEQECGIIMEPAVEFEVADEIVCYKVEKS